MLSEHSVLQQGTPTIRQTIPEQAMQARMRPFGSKLQLSGCLQAKGRQVPEAPEIIGIVLKKTPCRFCASTPTVTACPVARVRVTVSLRTGLKVIAQHLIDTGWQLSFAEGMASQRIQAT